MSWLFDPATRVRRGGMAAAYAFNPSTDVFVREVIQNSLDQKEDGSPTVKVNFRLSRLSGSSLDAFLSALSWQELEKHIESAADAGSHAAFLRQSISDLRTQRELLLLRIDDSGTKGLTGGDLSPDTPFASLCIDELFSTKASAGAGGSYGLGKSVLWRFSALSTVLFSSYLGRYDTGQDGLRLFGRAQLPWHKLGLEQFDGPCWFGKQAAGDARKETLSFWGAESSDIADRLLLARPKAPGTSILIVGFNPPAEEPLHPKELCKKFCTAATTHFWPVLSGDAPSLRVTSELFDVESGKSEARHAAAITEDVKPFAVCLDSFRAGQTTAELEATGSVASVELAMKIPGMLDGRPPVDGFVTLCVQLIPITNTKIRASHVAYIRGFGMVVRYRDLAGISLSAKVFVAGLFCGTKHGFSAADEAIEEFLRMAEPPEHHSWVSNQRLQSTYKKGYAKVLSQLEVDVADTIKRLVSTAATEGETGPELLSRMFPIGTTGKEKRLHPFTVTRRTATLTSGGVWLFSGEVRRTTGNGPWQVRVVLRFGTDDGAEGTVVGAITETKPASLANVTAGVAVIQVAADIDKISFKGKSDPQLHPIDSRRAAVRLDVMAGSSEMDTVDVSPPGNR